MQQRLASVTSILKGAHDANADLVLVGNIERAHTVLRADLVTSDNRPFPIGVALYVVHVSGPGG